MRKNLAVLAATAFFSGIHTSMVQVIWQPFALSLGASISTLGLLNSLGGYGGVVTSLVQPISGRLSDSAGHKRFLEWASVATLAGLGLYFMAGQAGQWQLLIPAMIFMGLSALSRPSRGALVADSSDEARRGSAYSLIMLATVSPGIFAPLLGGYIAEHAGRQAVFLIGLAFEAISLGCVIAWLGESKIHQAIDISPKQTFGIFRRAAVPLPHLRAFFLCVTGDAFVWGTGFGVLFGALSKVYGYSDAQLGTMSSTAAITMTLAQMPMGRLIDRYGAKPSLIASELLGIPVMLILLTQTRFEWLVASYALLGLVGATWGPAFMTYLAAHTPAGSRSEAIGQLSAFRGLLAFPAPALGGFLFEVGGFGAPIIFNLVGAIVVALGLALFLRDDRANGA